MEYMFINFIEFALEFRTMREKVIQMAEKRRFAREKRRQYLQEQKALARLVEDKQYHGNEKHSRRSSIQKSERGSRQSADIKSILGDDIDVTENGTLRRRKSHHKSHRRHRHSKQSDELCHGGESSGE